jgi:peptidoglycan/LPS O-acetylase OafA/YrhL
MKDVNNATGKVHLVQVDYIRAIASLSVALFHLGGKALPVLNYGWLGVELFFLLSGFIICWAIPKNYTLKSAGTFIIKRLIRIEPPYIISIGLVLLFNCILLPNYIVDWKNVLFHLAYINNLNGSSYLNPVYWTLGIEFQFYLFVALFYPVFLKKYSPYTLVALSIIPAVYTSSNLIAVFPLFALGILYFQYKSKLIPLNRAAFICFAIIICCAFSLGWLQAIAGLVGLFILMLPLKANKLVNFFSKISFSLYLTHDIIGSRAVVYLGTLFPKTFLYHSIEFVIGIAVSISFAWLFYLAVERPCLIASKKITYLKGL